MGQTTTFNFTGGPQEFVVPQGCYASVQIDAYGAQGGGSPVVAGGLGGHVQATIAVTPGETLYVYVGGIGDPTGTPGYNGGGSGIGGSVNNPGSGGGGASDVRKGGTALADRWVVAGGGGGGTENGGTAVGGAGGGLVGGDGAPGGNPWGCTPLAPPTGGTQVAGGVGGNSASCAWNGFDGTFGQGGNSYNQYRSSGGGGGWYGGGGAHNGTSGAGGSSYAHPTATNVTHVQGFQTGNGVVVITLVAGFVVDLGPDTTTCTSYVLDAGPAMSYLWNDGSTTQTVTAAASGTYTVVATDSAGCVGTDSVIVTISPNPTVSLGADTTACAPLTLDAGNAGSTYLWSSGDTSQTITAGAGTYSVTVTNGIGCAGTDDIVVTIPSAPTVSLGGVVAGCDSLVLDAGNPGETYLWSTGATSQSIVVASSGVYAVTVTETSCLSSSSDSVVVTIGSVGAVSIGGLAANYCDVDPPAALAGSPVGGVFSGPGISGTNFSPASAGAGTHTITYVYTDSMGCTGSTTAVTTVNICPAVGAPFPTDLVLYPNPTAGSFVIEGLADGSMVEVFDLLGAQVATITTQQSRLAVDLRAQARGMYIVRVQRDGVWYSKRVVVQ